jgi:cation:H+ antiporter
MLTSIALLLAGLALLTAGGEALVRGATTLARLARVTPAVIGLTVVAMGTSLPELAVSLLAALRGQPDLSVANVLGSNIFNVSATLGMTALVTALPVQGNAVRLQWPFMFVASCLCLLVMRDGRMDRMEGAVFMVSLLLFTAYAVRLGRREVAGRERAAFADAVEDRSVSERITSPARELAVASGLVVVSLALLVLGGRWLVDGATGIARLAGLTERVIGLTVVAAGTGMPELATSLVAAHRKQTDVAVANMIGSNIFNILGILGVTALVRPIPIARAMIATDAWWMIGTALLLFPLLWSGMRIRRAEGAVLLVAYVVYVVTLLR